MPKQSNMSTAKSNVVEKTSAKALEIIISLSIILSFFLIPLFFTGLVTQGLGFEKMILFYFLVLTGTVAWVTKGVVIGNLELKRTPLDWPILGIVFVYIVSTITSVNPIESFIGSYGSSTKGLLAVILFVLFYYLLVNNINKVKVKIVFWTLIASVSLIIVYSFLQLLGLHILPFDFTHIKSFNPIGSLTGLSMTISMFLPILIVAISQIQKIHPNINKVFSIITKVVLSLVLIIGLADLSLLNEYTFWLAAIVGIVVVLMFFLAKIVKVSNNNLIFPLLVFIAVITFSFSGNLNIIDNQLQSEIGLSRGSSWDIAKQSIMNDPVLGSGPSTFYYSFSKYKGANFNYTDYWNLRFDNASGVIFELVSTVGVLGVVAFIALLLISLSLMFLALIKNKDSGEHSILLGLFSACVVVLIFGGLFSINNTVIIISFLLFTLTTSLAITMYPETFKSLDLSFRASPKYALALSAMFLTALAVTATLFVIGVKIYAADHFAKIAILSNSVEARVEYLNKAIKLFPYQDKYYTELSNNYIILANEKAKSGSDIVGVQKYLSKAKESGEKAVEISPNNAKNIESLALVYENTSFFTRGALEWADSLYNNLIELEPYNPVPYLRQAFINMSRANAESDKEEKKYFIGEAIKKYDQAIEKKNNMSAAYYGKAVAYERLEDNNEAIEQLKRAVILDQDNIDFRFQLGRLYLNRGVNTQAVEQIATDEYTYGETNEEELSLESNSFSDDIEINDDIRVAEAIFISILQLNPNHANSLYSLALIYQKIDRNSDMKKVANRLLEILGSDEEKAFVASQFDLY